MSAKQPLKSPGSNWTFKKDTFGPRASLAYRVSGSFVIRAGYGLIWIEQAGITPNSYVVIATRGHKEDDAATGAAVRTPARYVGLVGSKRKSLLIFETLLAEGGSVSRMDWRGGEKRGFGSGCMRQSYAKTTLL